VEGFEEWTTFGHRPTIAFMPRFKNITTKEKNFLRGYYVGVSAGRGRRTDAAIGEELKLASTEPGQWHLNLGPYGECLPYADNRVTLDHNKKDKWGRPQIVVDCEFKENERAMHEDMKVTASEMMEAVGLKNIKVSGSMSFPGNANHEMGTARMGNDPKTSVLNKWNQMHEVSNVFITDGSCMGSSSYQNPSLTYMALTARACDYAVGEMKKMNI
jgi:choline dehydrogenase-like flavoprotein